MIYHGSSIPNLTEIEARESTQKESYVYGTTNIVYAAIFSILQRTDKPYPLKFGFKDKAPYIAERFEGQLDSIKNIKSSIYVLDDRDFVSFNNHSAGDSIELRANKSQKVLQEIKIDNVIDFLKKKGVIFYSYAEREKVGIPKGDKYFVKGMLKTYLWKIEGREDEDFYRGKEHIEYFKKYFPKYREFVDYLVYIINNLNEEDGVMFVEKFYNSKTDEFDKDVIRDFAEKLDNQQQVSKSRYGMR